MDRDSILETLRQHASELKAVGVTHLRVFGSVARGEMNAHSDVDLLADFDPAKTITLVTLGSLEMRLGDLLGARVEVSSTAWMRDVVRRRAVQEAIVAF